ncbi:phage tail sheath family protein [Tenacibaculum jejuense]|uniref:Afp3 n=1 Tax=Tenacibaculum jejuense TaxID=584609 RepID=A0A238UCJ9_9FLAO|nr:phage tail sheath C-terminal domain-containing protein [Tenacibaculum jejuense]SNR16933.1 Afp3 [Tenacibaculum jejuense]
MSNYLTPDVYTEEVSVLPPSVAGVSTAIPAFIGYTEKASKSRTDLSNTAVRITTFLEYKEIFGGAAPSSFSVALDSDDNITSVAVTSPKNTMYYALDMYFKNGGGDCYIISVGSYDDTYEAKNFIDGLNTLSKEDEPTLIVLGDAVNLSSIDYHNVCQQALLQCEDLKDRFCIFDIQHADEDASVFRSGIGSNNLKYGAAYTPFLQTSLNHEYTDIDVLISQEVSSSGVTQFSAVHTGIQISYDGLDSDTPKYRINGGAGDKLEFTISTANLLTISNIPDEGIEASKVLEAWSSFEDKGGFNITIVNDSTLVTQTSGNSGKNLDTSTSNTQSFTLESKRGTTMYSQIVNEINKMRVILPPSSSVAGAYATTDRERGVWKAPANISLNAITGPVRKISAAAQEKLNVEKEGKSVNAIRSFAGKGTLVWGARTLAGNDNEWRYVPVRRLFNMIEESTKNASYFAVFEPNTPATWLKVKAMIESFLYGIWQQGGLVGSTEEQAYFVNVGLGKTMTQQDVLDGKMIVEIGIAAARPAEFIILRFSHKLQEV